MTPVSVTGRPPTIRPCEPADVDAVVALSLRAWAPVFASFAKVLGAEIFDLVYPDWVTSQTKAVTEVCAGEHVFVAQHEGEVAGFVAVALRDDSPRTAEIDMIAVDPDHQRAGVGSALMSFAVDHMRAHGVVLADIATGGDPGHAAARATYAKAGFTALPLVRYYRAL